MEVPRHLYRRGYDFARNTIHSMIVNGAIIMGWLFRNPQTQSRPIITLLVKKPKKTELFFKGQRD
jgi:hypothetical protein